MAQESMKVTVPIITVASVDDVHKFYTERLGFSRLMGVLGDTGELNMVTLVLNGAKLMFARPRGEVDGTEPYAGKRPVEIYMEVTDVDAYHAELRERGVSISDPLTVQWWGDKTFRVKDPYGYEIWFYQRVGQPNPPQGLKVI